MATNRDPYDKLYFENIFARQIRNSQRNRNRVHLIQKVIQKGRLLEIGCGKGNLLCLLAPHYKVEGIDISRHAIRTQECPKGVVVRRADIQHTLLHTGAYEGIVALNVLEHLVKPAETLTKIFSSLKSNGVLFGSVPLNGAFLGRIHTGLTNIYDRTHVSTFSPDKWQELFSQAGFNRVAMFGEVNFGKNASLYVHRPWWKWVAVNLMFVCEK